MVLSGGATRPPGQPVGEPAGGASAAPRPDEAAAPEVVAGLEHGLRETRHVSIAALLTGTALIRVAASGVTVAVQFYLADLAHGHPHGTTIGLIGAGQALTEMVCAPFMARFADRLGRKIFVVAGPLVGALGVLLVAASAHPPQIFGSRLLEGVAAAAFVPTALGAIAAATSQSARSRARASGAFEAATLAGYAGGFIVGPFAYHYLGRGGFLVLAAVYLAAGLVCLRFVAHVPPLPVTRLSTLLRDIAGPGPIRRFLPAWLGTFALIGAYGSNLPALLHHAPVTGQRLVHHFDARLVSLILVSGIVLLVAGIALWTPWILRLGPLRQMRRAVPGAWLFSVALLLANHLPHLALLALLPVAALGILWLAGFGPAAVAYLANSSETHTADRSALMSFYTVTLAAGGAIGAALGGVAVSLASFDGLVVFGLILTVATYLLLGPLVRSERRAGSKPTG
ncbi:MAG: MFS transporter [Candidatus Dormibacteria bacterium]